MLSDLKREVAGGGPWWQTCLRLWVVLWLAAGCQQQTPPTAPGNGDQSAHAGAEHGGAETPAEADRVIARLNLTEPEDEPSGAAAGAVSGSDVSAAIRQLPDIAGMQNVFVIGSRVMSGSQPEGTEAFLALRDLGVSVVVSVDGTPPDLDAARDAGLRYVHIPIGYGGITREQQLALARVLTDEPESLIYFHCHHGRHRGPAAAAVACRMQGLLTAAAAEALLSGAQTSPDYAGLWQAVRTTEPPRETEQAPELQESVVPPGIVTVMKDIEHQFAASRAAAEKLPEQAAEFRQSNALLNQLLKEAARLPDAGPLAADLDSTAETVLLLNQQPPENAADAAELLGAIEQRCTKCHARTRDADADRQ